MPQTTGLPAVQRDQSNRPLLPSAGAEPSARPGHAPAHASPQSIWPIGAWLLAPCGATSSNQRVPWSLGQRRPRDAEWAGPPRPGGLQVPARGCGATRRRKGRGHGKAARPRRRDRGREPTGWRKALAAGSSEGPTALRRRPPTGTRSFPSWSRCRAADAFSQSSRACAKRRCRLWGYRRE